MRNRRVSSQSEAMAQHYNEHCIRHFMKLNCPIKCQAQRVDSYSPSLWKTKAVALVHLNQTHFNIRQNKTVFHPLYRNLPLRNQSMRGEKREIG